MKRTTYKGLNILTLSAFLICQTPHSFVLAQAEDASQADMKKDEILSLVIGDIQGVETKNLNKVSVTRPDIVDISDAKADKVLVVGKKPGETELFVWDDNGKRNITVRVATQNLDTLKIRVEEVLRKAQFKGVVVDKNEHEGRLILSGSVPKKDRATLDKVLEPYSDGIIDLVKQELIEDLIEIDAQVIEVSATLDKTLGLDWSNSTTGSGSSSSSTTGSSDNAVTNLAPIYGETLPTFSGKPDDFFKIGNFSRTTAFQATLNALINDNKARVISKPRLVVMSGKEASFLVGGEVPITTTTTTGGGSGTTSSSVTYKQYGVNMTITPTLRDGKIDVLLNMQLSDIDRSTADRNGDVGFTTRTTSTQLYLDDKQTIVLAGLIRHSDNNNVRKVAFLGDIPLVGALFRSRATPANDTELVIILTPRVLKSKKIATEQTTLPTKDLSAFKNEVEGRHQKELLDPPAVQMKENPVKPAEKAPAVAVPATVEAPVAKLTEKVVAPATTNEILPYVRSIQMRISQSITYPYEAIQNNWEGTVKLRLRILSDGSLADCDLLESSGHDVFDRDAQNTAKVVAPFSAFPESVRQNDVVITVPIVYNLRAEKTNAQTVVAAY